MRIAIVGSGALGCAIGAGIAGRGHEVIMVDAVETVVDRVNREGIIVAGVHDHRATPRAVTHLESCAHLGLAIFLVKTFDMAGAIRHARAGIGDETIVATFQNGLGADCALANSFDPATVVRGVTYLVARKDDDGVVRTAPGPSYVGPRQGPEPLAPAERLAEVMADAGFEATVERSIGRRVWEKLAVNCMSNAVSALAGLNGRAMLRCPSAVEVQASIAAEVVAVAAAEGHRLSLDSCVRAARATFSMAGHGSPSMRRDFEAGRRTEIDALNGAVARAAATHGISAPVNETVAALIRAWEEVTFLHRPGPAPG